ncbi:MAG TPA: hypothetical protein GXZ77_02005 [Papillibacter sp.]|jgi:hypothetical protein|nr:hypothetical protein [Papillibacter sp.]
MNKTDKPLKVYVAVSARFDENGKISPLSITWEDGREYHIDRILDVRRAASLKAGGAGIRYCVKIGRTETYLFLEENRWFVERRV